MPEYVIIEGDTQYRRVNVTSADVPKFEQAPAVGTKITYNKNQVLEIMHAGGTTELMYDNGGNRQEVRCEPVGREQPLCYRLNVDSRYTARMWLEVSGMRYKIPGSLPAYHGAGGNAVQETCVFRVNNRLENFRIVGDAYIEKLFRFPET